MPRKVQWTVLGIVGLSVLMCAGCSAEAQSTGTTTRGAQPGATQQANGQALPPGDAASLWRSMTELRAEVTQLRQEVTRLRAQVAQPGAAGTGAARAGTGGSGAAGTGDAQPGTGGSGTAGASGTQAAPGTGGSGPSGTQAPLVSDVPPAGSNVPAPRGTQVVNAVYTGAVSSVSAKQVVITMEDGAPLVLGVYPKTRVLREGRNIPVGQLEKGEQVRAVVDLVGQDKTLEIAVLPAAAPED
jgi:outer membrane murein-binding lipoprotein Lpp